MIIRLVLYRVTIKIMPIIDTVAAVATLYI